MIDMCVPLAGFQKRFEPQRLQKPRFAWADDSYQRSDSERLIDRCDAAQAVAATMCPLLRRHILQWQ